LTKQGPRRKKKNRPLKKENGVIFDERIIEEKRNQASKKSDKGVEKNWGGQKGRESRVLPKKPKKGPEKVLVWVGAFTAKGKKSRIRCTKKKGAPEKNGGWQWPMGERRPERCPGGMNASEKRKKKGQVQVLAGWGKSGGRKEIKGNNGGSPN